MGKTTTAVNLAACFGCRGYKVLVVDMDPNTSATRSLTDSSHNPALNVHRALVAKELDPFIEPSTEHNVDILKSTVDLASYGSNRRKGIEFSLKKLLNRTEEYDLVFIDSPPSLGILSILSMAAADELMIPVYDFAALDGMDRILDTFLYVRENANPDLVIGNIIMTMYDSRTNLARDIRLTLQDKFKGKVADTSIPRNVRVAEAPAYHKSVLSYDPESKGAIAYTALANELKGKWGI